MWRFKEDEVEDGGNLKVFLKEKKTVTSSAMVVSIKGQDCLCDCLCDAARAAGQLRS